MVPTEGKYEAIEHADNPRVPAFVLEVERRIDGVGGKQREEHEGQIVEGKLSVERGKNK